MRPWKACQLLFLLLYLDLAHHLYLFLDLQVSQANNRFFNELEDWLSQKAIFTAPSETKNIELGEVLLKI